MRRRRGKIVLILVAAGVLLAVAAALTHVGLNLPSSRARLDAEVAERIGATRLDAEIAPIERISWLGCADIPSARATVGGGGSAFEASASGLSVCPGLGGLSSLSLDRLSIERQTKTPSAAGRAGKGGKKNKKKRGLLPGPRSTLTPPTLRLRLHLGAIEPAGIPVLEKLGPFSFDGRLASSPAGAHIAGKIGLGSPAVPSRLPLETWVRYDSSTTTVRAEMSLSDFPLARLPAAGSDALFEHGTVAGIIRAEATILTGTADAEVEASVTGLAARSPRLARESVGPIEASFDGNLAYDIWSGKLVLRPSTFEANGIGVRASGEMAGGGDHRFRIEAEAGPIGYRSAIERLPAALRPDPSDLCADGPIEFRAKVSGPASDPEKWTTKATLDLARLERRPGAGRDLSGPFPFQPRAGRDGTLTPAFEVGPGNSDFEPLAGLPSTLVRAILLAEDYSFYGHAGFDFQEMVLALGRNLREGRAARGGSTITQQLAKNLFLGSEKTYARKVKEALLAIDLEATLSKGRILEIYSNVIEWGPGIRGIGPASRHYFGKPPSDLSTKEAAFLAAILPNPLRYHVYYDRGGLTERWEERVRELLAKLLSTGAISEEEYGRAVDTPLSFARG